MPKLKIKAPNSPNTCQKRHLVHYHPQHKANINSLNEQVKIYNVKDFKILTGQTEVLLFPRNGRVESGKILETLVPPPKFVSTFLIHNAKNNEIANYLLRL